MAVGLMAVKAGNNIMGCILVPWRFHGDLLSVACAGNAVGVVSLAADSMVVVVGGIELVIDIGDIPAGRREWLKSITAYICRGCTISIVAFQAEVILDVCDPGFQDIA